MSAQLGTSTPQSLLSRTGSLGPLPGCVPPGSAHSPSGCRVLNDSATQEHVPTPSVSSGWGRGASWPVPAHSWLPKLQPEKLRVVQGGSESQRSRIGCKHKGASHCKSQANVEETQTELLETLGKKGRQ